MNNNGKLIKQLEVGEMFFNPNIITSETVDQLLNGFVRTPAK